MNSILLILLRYFSALKLVRPEKRLASKSIVFAALILSKTMVLEPQGYMDVLLKLFRRTYSGIIKNKK